MFSNIYNHNCTLCSLHETAKTVCIEASGKGLYHAMVIGEAPGREEDERGAPFVGRAGQILDRVLKRAFVTDQVRSEILVTNVVKCRPPGNRRPETDEIDACFDYLSEEIAQVDPYVILALGNAAAQALLNETGITRLRGTWQRLDRERETWVMPTFHPSYFNYRGLDSEDYGLFTEDVEKFANRAIVYQGEGHPADIRR